jgi:hypothetical protein
LIERESERARVREDGGGGGGRRRREREGEAGNRSGAGQRLRGRETVFPPSEEGSGSTRDDDVERSREKAVEAKVKKRTDDVDPGAKRLRHRLVLVGLEALDDDLLERGEESQGT